VLFASAAYDSFVTLGRGEQEAYLRDFWNRHDPTPQGQQNAVEQKFYQRVAIANQQFGGYRRGMETDRGRVFIRYGPPDEVTLNLNPQDEELLGYVLPQEIEDPGLSLDEKLRQTRPRSRYDDRAYEIWEYQIRGDPLIPEYVHPGMQTGLKFIFVDELGYGDFSLVYTSIAGGLQ
jgi:GWxTD domain-containing protein